MTEKKRYKLVIAKIGDKSANVFEDTVTGDATGFDEYYQQGIVDLLNDYETELSMEREKVVYWRNKAKDIWGDMRTNVELEKQVKELEKEKEQWKSSACHDINLRSMLSFEIQKLSETKDISSFLDFYYKYFCKIDGDVE